MQLPFRHEGLYGDFPKANVILSSSFQSASKARSFIGVKIILCTLDLLSNSMLNEVIVRHVEMSTIIVDEASQIEISSYVPMLAKYTGLRKICFFGDDKQRKVLSYLEF